MKSVNKSLLLIKLNNRISLIICSSCVCGITFYNFIIIDCYIYAFKECKNGKFGKIKLIFSS